MTRIVFVLALSAACLSSGCVPDIRPTPGKAHQMVMANWKTIGERAFDFQAETETIELGEHKGGYRELSLRVKERAVRVEVVEVIHEKGEPSRFELAATIAAGQGSKPFVLQGGRGIVTSVRVTYSDPNPDSAATQSARVTLHGRQ